MDVKQRVKGTDAKVQKVIDTMDNYDLSPLASWCGSGFYVFSNLGGTDIDFAGSDIGLDVKECGEDERDFLIQDKWRSTGDDLGQEFARVYEYEFEDGSKELILDVGRDLFRIPTTPIVTDGKFAERDWKTTGTVSDFFLFHNRDPDSPRVFIKSDVAKSIGKRLFLALREKWDEIAPIIQDRVFDCSKTLSLKDELGTKFFVTALREPKKARGSTKGVIYNGRPVVHCWISKVIVYIKLSQFTEDQIKFCPRKKT